MALEITGRLIQKLNKTEGVSKANKPWSKQEFVIETQEQYPRKVCMSVMNEKINDLDNINVGDIIKASLNIESREYNGKWYTDVRAWRIEPQGGTQAPNHMAPPTSTGSNTPEYNPDPATDDLPF